MQFSRFQNRTMKDKCENYPKMLKSNFFHLYLFPLGRQCNPQLRIYLSDLTRINLKMHSRGRSGSLIPISWSFGGEDSVGGPVFWCQGVVKDLRLSLGRNISHGQSPLPSAHSLLEREKVMFKYSDILISKCSILVLNW